MNEILCVMPNGYFTMGLQYGKITIKHGIQELFKNQFTEGVKFVGDIDMGKHYLRKKFTLSGSEGQNLWQIISYPY